MNEDGNSVYYFTEPDGNKDLTEAEEYLSQDSYARCPYCGKEADHAFLHYQFCALGMDIERLGYVVGWERRDK